MVNPRSLPYEELIGAAVALGIIETFTEGRRMDRVDLELQVERRQPEAEDVIEDDQYGEFDFR